MRNTVYGLCGSGVIVSMNIPLQIDTISMRTMNDDWATYLVEMPNMSENTEAQRPKVMFVNPIYFMLKMQLTKLFSLKIRSDSKIHSR
jgi:hypothetical protein